MAIIATSSPSVNTDACRPAHYTTVMRGITVVSTDRPEPPEADRCCFVSLLSLELSLRPALARSVARFAPGFGERYGDVPAEVDERVDEVLQADRDWLAAQNVDHHDQDAVMEVGYTDLDCTVWGLGHSAARNLWESRVVDDHVRRHSRGPAFGAIRLDAEEEQALYGWRGR